ncbi:MAG: HAD family phosphatase [Clostridia bacterium]|nr:HAD family phosphatase [Clostridia bacterium]
MKPRLLVFDLDGTLLAPDHKTVTERTALALRLAHAQGAQLVIATGRTLNLTDEVTAQLPMIDWLILSNGAVLYDRARRSCLTRTLIPAAHTAQTAALLEGLPAFSNFYIDGKVHTQREKLSYFYDLSMPEAFLDFFRHCMEFHTHLPAAAALEQINVYSRDPAVGRTVLAAFEENGYTISSTMSGEMTANAAGVNKGAALRKLCDTLGLPLCAVAAFGDAGNDRDLLTLAGLGVAMGNADAGCRAAADRIAPTNAEDGVAAVIEELFRQE